LGWWRRGESNPRPEIRPRGLYERIRRLGFAPGPPGGGLAGNYPVLCPSALRESGLGYPAERRPFPGRGPPGEGRAAVIKRPEPTRCRRLFFFPLVDGARVPGSLPPRPPIPVEAVSPPRMSSYTLISLFYIHFPGKDMPWDGKGGGGANRLMPRDDALAVPGVRFNSPGGSEEVGLSPARRRIEIPMMRHRGTFRRRTLTGGGDPCGSP